MKAPRISEAFGNIPEDLVSEAIAYRRISKKKSFIKWGTIAACLVLIVTSVLVLIPGGFFKTENPGTDPLKIVYAKDLEIKIDDRNSENIMISTGCVKFTGSLYDIVRDAEPYIDCTFAVSVSFSMEFKESEEYLSLIAEAEDLYESMWNRYYNEFQPHILNVHNTEVMDWNCEECLQYKALHEQDEIKIDDLNREALRVSEIDRENHDKKVRECGNSLFESMNLEYRFVTINWTNMPDSPEPVITQELRILHLTKEQLLNFKVPDEIGAEFILLPEWVDCGESVIYRDYSLYPIEIEEQSGNSIYEANMDNVIYSLKNDESELVIRKGKLSISDNLKYYLDDDTVSKKQVYAVAIKFFSNDYETYIVEKTKKAEDNFFAQTVKLEEELNQAKQTLSSDLFHQTEQVVTERWNELERKLREETSKIKYDAYVKYIKQCCL